MDAIRIQPVTTEAELNKFIHFSWQIYADDPNWVPPLISQVKKRLDVERNPFFQMARRELFLAYQGQTVVGTIAAIVNDQYNRQIGQKTGFFGFFESLNDLHIAEQLFNTAAAWLRVQGMAMMRGPVNGAPTDEVGILISGHQRRPVMWTGHSPPYYQHLHEALGFYKYDDVFAYEATYEQIGRNLNNLPDKLWQAAHCNQQRPHVTIRQMNPDRWEKDAATAHALYNVAFRSIDGHIDMSREKFMEMARGIRLLLDPKLALMVEVAGQPVGFALALPDVNEVLCHFNGRVSGIGKLKFLWHLRRVRTACFKLLGVLPEFRAQGLEGLLITHMLQQLVQNNYERLDMSLASEKNVAINRILQRLGGQIYKSYRIYERPL